MSTNTSGRILSLAKRAFDRYLVKAMSGMALGLFASVIVSVLIAQLARIPIPGFTLLADFAAAIGAASPVVGAAIGVGIAHSLGHRTLVMLSTAACGAYGYAMGGPLGAYFAAVAGAEVGGLVSGRTRLDIVLVPLTTIIPGSLVGFLVGPGVQSVMTGLGRFINWATEQRPLPMGILVSVVFGLVLVSPISSAALAITLNLSGLAAGAALAGCSAQMAGFALTSFPENRWDGFFAQGLGSAKLQLPNIMRRPVILLPTLLGSAVTGALSTVAFRLETVAQGAGMGNCGLVGPITAFTTMADTRGAGETLLAILMVCFVLPTLLALPVSIWMRRKNLIRDGDMTLHLTK